MTNSFTHTLLDGSDVTVVWEFIDEDETVGLPSEFEYQVFFDGLEITNALTTKDQTKIESEIAHHWKQFCEQERLDADIARWESEHG